jgi:hypothetical protein
VDLQVYARTRCSFQIGEQSVLPTVPSLKCSSRPHDEVSAKVWGGCLYIHQQELICKGNQGLGTCYSAQTTDKERWDLSYRGQLVMHQTGVPKRVLTMIRAIQQANQRLQFGPDPNDLCR